MQMPLILSATKGMKKYLPTTFFTFILIILVVFFVGTFAGRHFGLSLLPDITLVGFAGTIIVVLLLAAFLYSFLASKRIR